MSKILKAILCFFKAIYRVVDKLIVTPISRFIYNIGNRFRNNPSSIEKFLNRPNILLYLSLIFAVGIFFLVDSQVITLVEKEAEILSNQPVNVLYNKEAYVIEGLVDQVDIILTGRKSSIYLAKQLGDHDVVLDLTDYEASDTPVKVPLSYNQTVDNISYKLDPSYVTVTIKKKESQVWTNVSYELLNANKLDEKLSVDAVELDKTEVVIKGSRESLDKVATVKALIDLSNKRFTDAGNYDISDIRLVAYDSSGAILTNIEVVPTTITGSITLGTYSTVVPIKVLATGDLITGKSISSITINGKSSYSLTIYGEKSIIDEIKSIPVTIDVANQGNNGAKTYNVTIAKPNGVRHISEENARVVVSFGDEKQKTLDISNIGYRNLGSGLKANLVGTIQVPVQVKGVQSVIDTINADNISAYTDLSGYGVGDYEVDVVIESDDPRVSYVVTTKVKISISQG